MGHTGTIHVGERRLGDRIIGEHRAAKPPRPGEMERFVERPAGEPERGRADRYAEQVERLHPDAKPFARLADEWGVTLEPALVNGQPGVRAIAPDGRLVNVLSIDVADGAVQRIHSMLNPDKLGHLGPLSDVALRPAVRGAAPA